MVEKGVLSLISFNKITEMVKGDDIESVIKKNKEGHEQQMKNLKSKENYDHILLEDLLYIRKLGEG